MTQVNPSQFRNPDYEKGYDDGFCDGATTVIPLLTAARAALEIMARSGHTPQYAALEAAIAEIEDCIS